MRGYRCVTCLLLLLGLVAFSSGCSDPLISTGKEIDGTWELQYLEVTGVQVYCPVNCEGNTWNELSEVIERLVLDLGGKSDEGARGTGEASIRDQGKLHTRQLSWRNPYNEVSNSRGVLYLRFENEATERRFEATLCCNPDVIEGMHALKLYSEDRVLEFERRYSTGSARLHATAQQLVTYP